MSTIAAKRVTRWSGAPWADQQREITIIGIGGVGSWLSVSLSRIGHSLILVDMDMVDETNVSGGQAYRTSDIGQSKVDAIMKNCLDFGAIRSIMPVESPYIEELISPITICGLDNMATRKQAFEDWVKMVNTITDKEEMREEYLGVEDFLFIDGRLSMEMMEIFCIQGNNPSQIEEYRKNHLFSDEEAEELGCTVKQSTFAAMGIASLITATLCNWLTNNKMKENIRECPFYQRMYLPALSYNVRELTT